jgi:hypothetical protein
MVPSWMGTTEMGIYVLCTTGILFFSIYLINKNKNKVVIVLKYCVEFLFVNRKR